MVAGFSLPTSPCTFAFSNSVQDFTLIFAQFSLSGAPEVILNPDSVSSDIYDFFPSANFGVFFIFLSLIPLAVRLGFLFEMFLVS